MNSKLHNKKVHFSYIIPTNFSGQSASSDLIIEVLSERGWAFQLLPLYALQRSIKNPIARIFSFFIKQARILPGLLSLLFSRNPILYINLGQGMWSFLRVGWWFFPIYFLKKRLNVVFSLNGSVFMTWSKYERVTKTFLKLLGTAKIITVVGGKHKEKLIQLGINTHKIRIVPNTCELNVADDEAIVLKHTENNKCINILHLSLLIESKGFPEYLEALEILAHKQLSKPVNAVLCGTLSLTSFCKRFKTPDEKENWIDNKIKAINSVEGSMVNVKWIKGARGTEKNELFSNAQIFVLPTYFPVEAQPLVLMEALSAGCTIITTTVGEILSTVSTECAIIIEKPTPQNIADELLKLIEHDDLCLKLALTGAELMRGPFSLETYGNTWQEIFEQVME